MAVEITNVMAALCAVDTTTSPPRFKGGTANAGFAPFADPAGDTDSERISAGVYRMHLLQQFKFSGGEASPTATVNRPQPFGIEALGVDPSPGIAGCDVMVIVGSAGSEGPVTEDGDFTLVVWQFPVQSTG